MISESVKQEVFTPHQSNRWSLAKWIRQANQGNRLTMLLIFLPPALLIFTIFVIFPLGEAAYYGFFKWNGYGEVTNYIGLKNYERIFKHSVFSSALWNTAKIILVSLFIQLPLGLALALAIYKKGWGNNIFRLIFFLPFILAEVVAGLIWRFIFDGDYGIFPFFAGLFNQESIYVLAEKEWAFTAVLVVIIWKYFGFHMMIYIAGLQGVSEDLIEAAHLDGATPLQTIWYIKIPLIWPAIRISIFFSVLGAMQAFDIIIAMLPSGGPAHSAHSIVTYLYQFGIVRTKIGFGSAVGLVLFIISIVFAFTYQNTVMREKK